jgi:hypothetical protein
VERRERPARWGSRSALRRRGRLHGTAEHLPAQAAFVRCSGHPVAVECPTFAGRLGVAKARTVQFGPDTTRRQSENGGVMSARRTASLSVRLILLVALGCGAFGLEAVALPAFTTSTTEETTCNCSDTWSIRQFMDETYREIAVRSPLNATYEGISSLLGIRNDTLDDVSVEYVRGTYELIAATLGELRSHDRGLLSRDDQLNYDIYKTWLETKLDGEPYAFHNYDPEIGRAHV